MGEQMCGCPVSSIVESLSSTCTLHFSLACSARELIVTELHFCVDLWESGGSGVRGGESGVQSVV